MSVLFVVFNYSNDWKTLLEKGVLVAGKALFLFVWNLIKYSPFQEKVTSPTVMQLYIRIAPTTLSLQVFIIGITKLITTSLYFQLLLCLRKTLKYVLFYYKLFPCISFMLFVGHYISTLKICV